VAELTGRDRLTAVEVDEVAGIFEAARLADERTGAGELPSFVSQPGVHVLAADNGRVVGYAHLDTAGDSHGHPVGEALVHPASRNRGVGTQLVQRLLDLAGDREPRLWSHGDHPAAAAIAATLGLNRVRELRRMRWTVGDVPQPQLREGVRIRTFVPGQDEEAVVAVNHRAFSWHPEQGALTVDDLLATERESWFDPAGFFLAVDASDRLLGFHWTKIHPGPPEAIGEVYVVGVDPEAQGGGLGKALTVIGMEHLRAAGLRSVMLYVESDNSPAVAVYSKLGFTVWDADAQYGR
jgi:mycothiol synthase